MLDKKMISYLKDKLTSYRFKLVDDETKEFVNNRLSKFTTKKWYDNFYKNNEFATGFDHRSVIDILLRLNIDDSGIMTINKTIEMIEPNEEYKNLFLELWKDPNYKKVVISHKQCNDGKCSAAVALATNVNSRCIMLQHNDYDFKTHVLDCIEENSVLLIADFSFTIEQLEQLISKCKAVYNVDHHHSSYVLYKNATPDIKKHIQFDEAKCGAKLTWELFNSSGELNTPLIIDLVQQRDLWLWSYPKILINACAEIVSNTEPLDIIKFLNSDFTFEEEMQQVLPIIKYKQSVIEKKAEKYSFYTINGIQFAGKELTNDLSEVLSEIGAVSKLPAVGWFVVEDGFVFSLRSAYDDWNVAEIAKSITPAGGGHKGAAGFKLSFDEIDYEQFFKHKNIKIKD